MSSKTIAKISGFVILAAAVSAMVSSCGMASSGDRRGPRFEVENAPYQNPTIVGQIKSGEITESSGLAASPCQPGVLWTHNDSGDGPYLFALDLKGKHLGTWKVTGAENDDWEDMAAYKDTAGRCFLYIGEIGNTEKLERAEHKIYRVKEPVVLPIDVDSTRKTASQTEPPADVLSYRYDTNHDAETLMVHPQTADIYILTKHRSKPSSVYKLKPEFATGITQVAEKIGEFVVPAVPNGFLTGGSISQDGNRVVICDYAAAYELVLPADTPNFDAIWGQKPLPIDLGTRKQGEAITYSSDGKSILATSERKNAPVIEVKRR